MPIKRSGFAMKSTNGPNLCAVRVKFDVSVRMSAADLSSNSSYLHLVSKIAANPWGQIWVMVFRGGQDSFVGHSGSWRIGEASRAISRTGEPMSCLGFEKAKHRPVRGPDAKVGAGRCPAPFATSSASCGASSGSSS